ncbi:transposable element Tcb2 transposase [Trichonephila clavipes]|nr:transposable element Tcb2 transposase [Trichonephila clavipes]
MRGRIIGKIEEGRKITDVAREFDIAHSVVSRLWKSFKTTGMCSRRHGGAQQVANQFLAASGKQISGKTVARRLRGGGLYARRPVVCVPLTRQHRTARLQWCREHHNWTEQDWACVLFSDESRLSLSSDCRCQLIWRESGTAYRPENIQEKDRYPTCSIMVWAGIMINGRTCLHVVANGTMTGQRYIDEVLLPRVRLFRGAVGNKFVFMDDNATCHRTLAVQDCLDSEDIQRLVWPARSPDLNPIENVRDALGRQVAGRNYPPTNKNTLIRALTEEWDKLPQQLLDNVAQKKFRQLFVTHQKASERTWIDFYHELNTYFNGWIDGLKIDTFNKLSDLIITDQLKRKTPFEFKEYYLDEWANMNSPVQLAEKLEEFEDFTRTLKQKSSGPNVKKQEFRFTEKNRRYESPGKFEYNKKDKKFPASTNYNKHYEAPVTKYESVKRYQDSAQKGYYNKNYEKHSNHNASKHVLKQTIQNHRNSKNLQKKNLHTHR